jgi:hypothetical protein
MPLDLRKKERNGRPLTAYDIEILLDRSGSMEDRDPGMTTTRWQQGQKTVKDLAVASQTIDDDGITVGCFDNEFHVEENTTPEAVDRIFSKIRPRGSTNTAGALSQRLDAYFERRDGKKVTKKVGGFLGVGGKEVTEVVKPEKPAKPVIILVYTDGCPDSQSALENVIISATKKMNSQDEVAIVFMQCGFASSATAFLKQLDDGLEAKGAKYDIVSCLTIDEVKNYTTEQLLEKSLTGKLS